MLIASPLIMTPNWSVLTIIGGTRPLFIIRILMSSVVVVVVVVVVVMVWGET